MTLQNIGSPTTRPDALSLSRERLELIESRIASGYYHHPYVSHEVARTMLASGDLSVPTTRCAEITP